MLSVLTVNYYSANELQQLIASLQRYPAQEPMELIVTNNSPDEVIRPQAGKLPVTVLDQSNVGFASGINLAFRLSRGERLLIANPDLCVTAGALDAAIDLLDQRSDVGILLPRLRYPDGQIQPSVRRFYTWPVVLYARSPLRRLRWHPAFFRTYLQPELHETQPTEVDWGLGGAMFLRRSDCEGDRIFDGRYFLYFEDVDLCLRMWQRGKRVIYCPNVECIHDHRRDSRRAFSAAGWHHFRSLLRFIAKYRGLPQRPDQIARPARSTS